MKNHITVYTCDRCGYTFQHKEIHKEPFQELDEDSEEELRNREYLHTVDGIEICDKCYDEYKSFFKEFLPKKKRKG